MKRMKLFSLFGLLFLFACYGDTLGLDLSCGNWLPFKDEKCIAILDDTTRTFAEAEKACAQLEDSPNLVTIHSKEEQDFLSNYLFNISKKVENFWIGAKVTNSKVNWIDNSELGYTNWDKKGPRNKADYCVEMQADEAVVGMWLDEPCIKKNLVVCQRTWSLAKLQKTLMDARKVLKDLSESMVSTNKKISDQLDDANKKISHLNQSSIPIGFIYTQIPNTNSPSEIWPSFTWTDVSDSYAGVFFRVGGAGAESFGSIQAENAPRLTQVQTDVNSMRSTKVTIGPETSYWVWSGDREYSATNAVCLRFTISGGEVRPRNMAIRVWKRTG